MPQIRRLAAAILLIAALVTVAGCGSGSDSGSKPAATKNAAALEPTPLPKFAPATKEVANVKWNLIYGEPVTLDAGKIINYGDLDVMSNLCEPLEYLEPDGKREPALATSIKQTDPTSYTVNVRKGVKFWDGNPLTAEDVAFSMNRIRDPKTASFYGGFAANVKSITATGPLTVTIKMKKPDVLYREMLDTPLGVITEQKYVEEKGTTYGTPQGGVMCTGPYELKKWNSGSNIELTRNEDWWNAGNVKAWPKSATFSFVTDPGTSTSALNSGELDGEFNVPPEALPTLQNSTEGQLLTGPSTEVISMFLTQNKGTIANPKIRQAIAKLIDYEGFAASQYYETAVPARALAGPNAWVGAESTYRKAYEELPDAKQDLKAAKKLVEGSGIQNPTVRIAIFNGYSQEAALASQIQSSGKSIGLNVTFDNLSLSEFTNLFSSESARNKYDLMMEFTAADIPEVFELLQSVARPGGANNLGGWSDPAVTKLIEEAQEEPNATKRAQITVEAQKTITEEEVAIPAVYPNFTAFVNKGFAGVQPSMPSVMYHPWLTELGAP